MKLVITDVVKETTPILQVSIPVHRIMCVDCSGSMYNELPKLRLHLKNKLPTLVQPQDTLSIIWFSGRGQCGALFQNMKLDNLADIQKINTAIDRFLVPVGMTGFKEPLELVSSLVAQFPGDTTLSFLSDGGENQSPRKEVLKVCAALADKLASVTVVEYGFYADHTMLMDMAEEVSGSVILAEDFNSYSENLNKSFSSKVSGKKIKIHKIKAEFVIGNSPTGFVIAKPDAVGTVTLPASTTSYSVLEGTGNLTEISGNLQAATFAVSALILRGAGDIATQVAGLIGDETLYTQVENSFSKQDYARTVELANSYGTSDKALYGTKPRNTNLVPDENAYNVLTMLMDLAEGDGNYLDLSHPEFSYKPIGEARVVQEDDNGYKPKFSDKNANIKAEIKALKFNEDRPNISILVRREGSVNLKPNNFGFGESFDTFIWRNYTIVKDGIVNVQKLPVVLSKSTYDLFAQLGVVTAPFKIGQTYVIDTKKFPIINRSMVKQSKAEDLFKSVFALYTLRAKQKILGSKIEKDTVGAKFAALYGEDGALFLKEIGITEGGFGPKGVKGDTMDPYMSKVLEVSLSGLNSLPSVADVEKAIAAKKKLTPSQQVMSNCMTELGSVKDTVAALKAIKKDIQSALNAIVTTKFGVIVGRKWFTDMTMENPTMELDFGVGKPIKCTMVLEDKAV